MAPIDRFVFADPEKFREREVWKCRITSELDNAGGAQLLIDLLALRFGADVAPDQRRADNGIVFIEHNGTVHLTGETDAGDIGATQSRL
jgi:hypothetical protein